MVLASKKIAMFPRKYYTTKIQDQGITDYTFRIKPEQLCLNMIGKLNKAKHSDWPKTQGLQEVGPRKDISILNNQRYS